MTDISIERLLVRACVHAYAELNGILARDGAPQGVDEDYFRSVIRDLDHAVLRATGYHAHLHPELFISNPESPDES